MNEAAARIAVSRPAVQPRKAKAAIVMTAPARTVISHAWPRGSSSRNRPSCAPNSGPALSFTPRVCRNVNRPATALATV
jgi:hypothetical protein